MKIVVVGKVKPERHSDTDIHHPSGITGCLDSTMHKHPRYVLVSPKLTNTPPKSTKSISQPTKTMATSQQSTQTLFQTSTSSLEDSLAKVLALLESEEDLKIQEALCSLTSLESFGLKDPNILFLRTSKDCSPTTKAIHSKLSSQRLMNWGTSWNGKCLTARISESHRIGKECSLSDILEENPDEKYFLSEAMQNHLARRLEKI